MFFLADTHALSIELSFTVMVTDRTNQSPVPLVHRDPSDLGSQILIRILPKEHNLYLPRPHILFYYGERIILLSSNQVSYNSLFGCDVSKYFGYWGKHILKQDIILMTSWKYVQKIKTALVFLF